VGVEKESAVTRLPGTDPAPGTQADRLGSAAVNLWLNVDLVVARTSIDSSHENVDWLTTLIAVAAENCA
jgi:hypothetical protein